jgi:hypothetical protein
VPLSGQIRKAVELFTMKKTSAANSESPLIQRVYFSYQAGKKKNKQRCFSSFLGINIRDNKQGV